MEIAKKVCAVKAEVQPVGKNGFNPHGKYKHSTVDDVYHAVRPLLAQHGLDLRTDIVRREFGQVPNRENRQTAVVHFQFAIAFVADGGEAEVPVTRHLTLPYTGPQTDEIAISYVQKQFLRARLQLETGDFESEAGLGDTAGLVMDAIDEGQRQFLATALEETQSDVDRFLRLFGVDSLAHLPAKRWEEAKALVNRKRIQQAEAAAKAAEGAAAYRAAKEGAPDA